jgi:riboflavin biosynthesis pyrimidine reductase
MTSLTPFQSLHAPVTEDGVTFPLPVELSNLYGPLQFPLHAERGRPYVVANFVSSVDGIVSLDIPGHSAGGEISGFNAHDRMLMGILRAAADAVIVGAGTLRAVSPDHIWTAAYIYPAFAEAYQAFRDAMGKTEPPLNVVVSARGEFDLSRRLFQSGEVPVLIVTTAQGQESLSKQPIPSSTTQIVVGETLADGQLSMRSVLDACKSRLRQSDLILTEGGPRLMANFLAEKCLDELFLTVAPQIAGRDVSHERLALVSGKIFAPDQPCWGKIASIKLTGSHLFLRYAFETV